MRPSCQDGVLVAHGHLFWGPWMCDCNLTLVGVVSLAPAGDFDFAGKIRDSERLEAAADAAPVADFEIGPADWPTLRANNARTATSPAGVPDKVQLSWTFQPPAGLPATAPTAAGGLVFVGGHDGAVRAIESATGEVRWTAYTGGPISYPPTLWKGRALVGSGDGWIYCFEAATGRRLWRFRAAPAERVIPVYGSLRSTWPVASGVLVEDGVAYAAAGIANYDGTHVFALDAETGRLRWHNHTSGSLDPQTHSGVSVNGHLLLHGGQLHLAGGNMVPVASYDLADGRCVTDPERAQVAHPVHGRLGPVRGRRPGDLRRPAAVFRARRLPHGQPGDSANARRRRGTRLRPARRPRGVVRPQHEPASRRETSLGATAAEPSAGSCRDRTDRACWRACEIPRSPRNLRRLIWSPSPSPTARPSGASPSPPRRFPGVSSSTATAASWSVFRTEDWSASQRP